MNFGFTMPEVQSLFIPLKMVLTNRKKLDRIFLKVNFHNTWFLQEQFLELR